MQHALTSLPHFSLPTFLMRTPLLKRLSYFILNNEEYVFFDL
jgi:hypothetical protein